MYIYTIYYTLYLYRIYTHTHTHNSSYPMYAVNFPEILYEIISNEKDNHAVISWLPHGKGFVIHDKKVFSEKILPDHFDGAKYTSFTRRLKRWNFERVPRGPEMGAYYNKFFRRGRPDLVSSMMYGMEDGSMAMEEGKPSKHQSEKNDKKKPSKPTGKRPAKEKNRKVTKRKKIEKKEKESNPQDDALVVVAMKRQKQEEPLVEDKSVHPVLQSDIHPAIQPVVSDSPPKAESNFHTIQEDEVLAAALEARRRELLLNSIVENRKYQDTLEARRQELLQQQYEQQRHQLHQEMIHRQQQQQQQQQQQYQQHQPTPYNPSINYQLHHTGTTSHHNNGLNYQQPMQLPPSLGGHHQQPMQLHQDSSGSGSKSKSKQRMYTKPPNGILHTSSPGYKCPTKVPKWEREQQKPPSPDLRQEQIQDYLSMSLARRNLAEMQMAAAQRGSSLPQRMPTSHLNMISPPENSEQQQQQSLNDIERQIMSEMSYPRLPAHRDNVYGPRSNISQFMDRFSSPIDDSNRLAYLQQSGMASYGNGSSSASSAMSFMGTVSNSRSGISREMVQKILSSKKHHEEVMRLVAQDLRVGDDVMSEQAHQLRQQEQAFLQRQQQLQVPMSQTTRTTYHSLMLRELEARTLLEEKAKTDCASRELPSMQRRNSRASAA